MVIGSTLKVGISELSPKQWEKLERQLTFATPGGEVVTVYRKIMSSGYYRLPRGALSFMPPVEITADNRSRPKMPSLEFTLKLDDTARDPRFAGQEAAVKAILSHSQGQIIRPPGTGKTQIALAFSAWNKTRTLVLVHTEDILQQWIEYTENAIPELKGQVGVIQGKDCNVGHITIATVQTLRNFVSEKPRDWWRQFGAVIVDEAHHAAAGTWEHLLNVIPAYYRVGFTASATRADGMHPAIAMLIGPVIHRQKFSSPVKLKVKPVKTKFYFPYRGPFDWGRLVRALIADKERNEKIAKLIDKEIQAGNSVLVLSRRIEHLENIGAAMQEEYEILTARRSKADRKKLLRQFRSGVVSCILATQLADEALDVPRLNRVFLVHPGKHEGRLVQQIGRAIRQHDSKTDAVIYDVVDTKVKVLARQWRERKRAYGANKISVQKKGRVKWR